MDRLSLILEALFTRQEHNILDKERDDLQQQLLQTREALQHHYEQLIIITNKVRGLTDNTELVTAEHMLTCGFCTQTFTINEGCALVDHMNMYHADKSIDE